MPEWALLETIGMVMIVLGLFIIVFWGISHSISQNGRSEDSIEAVPETKQGKIRGGGVVMIGPIPVVFGTDKKYVLIAMLMAILLMVLAILLLK